MKLEILTENFKKSLSVIEKIIRKNNTLPIINDVLLTAEKNFLKITATNLESSIIWNILSNIKEEGSVAIPANFMSLLVNSINDEKIDLSDNNGNLILKTKKQNTQIQGHNIDDFPIIPTIKRTDYIEIDSVVFKNALEMVVNIPSISQIRPEISGVYFSFKKDTLRVVGTDSFRLAEKSIKIEEKPKNDFSFILSQKSSKELLAVLLTKEGKTRLYYTKNQIMFEWGDKNISFSETTFQSRLINGEYPEYQEIIPKKYSVEIRLKKDEFQEQVKKASLFSGKTSEVKISIRPEESKIVIFSQSPEVGEIELFIPSDINVKSKDFDEQTIFNYKFLLDGISTVKSSELIFNLSTKGKPALIKPVGDDSYLYILMPIKN